MIAFVVNHTARAGKAQLAVPIIERMARERGVDFRLIYAATPGDLAAEIDIGSLSAIVCVGGDGTAQKYVAHAVRREINFGIIPAGSGNDFLRSVPGAVQSFGTFADKIAHYTAKIFEGNTMPADVVAVNDADYFLNIGGTGIDIQVLKDAKPLKKALGGAAYLVSLMKNVATYRTQELALTVDGQREAGEFLLLAVANGAYYGGNLHIAPGALINDGLLTLVKVRKMPRLKMMAMFPLVKPGRHVGMREVSLHTCKEVALEYTGSRTINLDGNLQEYASSVTFKVVPGAVRLIV